MTDQAKTPYELVGGGAAVTAIANRFYDLIESDSAYAELRALHGEALDEVREGLASFLGGWMGGPRDWFASGRCVMSLHGSLPISRDVARQWVDAMDRAIAEQPGLPADFSKMFRERLGQMAHAMVNSEHAQKRAGMR